ncbi:MAG: calcium-translocating P-type ATPase, PMCA-type [Clostridia bacterium]|nr:calcium-translocating P-type ATPase, PMCA-type [Clostridia bacterium]
MNFYDKPINQVISSLNSDQKNGLSRESLTLNSQKYGYNSLSKAKKTSLIKRIGNALKEPMLLILLFGFMIAFGANLGKFIKSGEGDFIECFGILFAVILSVGITLVMEGSSEKAFATLNRAFENISVKVIRQGEIIIVDKKFITVGDIVIIESGDKIIADGRLIESNSLLLDESSLTGESQPCSKNASVVLVSGTTLAERTNMVYSGTFVSGGMGKMIVTAVGDNTEMGKIASGISTKRVEQSPLQHKLSKLGRLITIIGAVCAVLIFIISTIRLIMSGNVTFNGIQDLLLSCIILIIAAVPEGLPTIVAVSLALNMIKLAKENALIKKMTATETAGAVSVICSDKTGTLTQNKMTVSGICCSEYCVVPKRLDNEFLIMNFIINNSAEIVKEGSKTVYKGSGTECALIKAVEQVKSIQNYKTIREIFPKVHCIPFSSERKCMLTSISYNGAYRTFLKGSPEKVLSMSNLTEKQKSKIFSEISKRQLNAERILCFAHYDGEQYPNSDNDFQGQYVYDGFVCLKDPVRKEVKKAINDCKRAGIKIKILTGDNVATALAVARELGIASDENSVLHASVIESLTDEQLIKILPKITVIARSTPSIKLRVVKILKSMGEVVAVTGDGINDSPAIKHADVGIAMGISGSDITKETADVVLLDDSFATVVKTVSFGRNVYRNLQRFIMFQLSVNFSALAFITVCAILGLPSPFNTLQLLWINVIMDGPPALTLGLEVANNSLMNQPPVRRSSSIVNKKMLFRIAFNGIFIGGIMLAQTLTNFLGANFSERSSCMFTLFILFQLFNAFNSKELGAESIFKSVGKNKVMLWTFGGVFLLHVIIVTFFYPLFSISPMSITLWIKCVIIASSIIWVVEAYKLVYRKIKKGGSDEKRDNKTFIFKNRLQNSMRRVNKKQKEA